MTTTNSLANTARRGAGELRRVLDEARREDPGGEKTRAARSLTSALAALKIARRRCRIRVKDDGSVEVAVTVLGPRKRDRRDDRRST
jgi:hypothetical protein